jgi:hypothetical protein
MICADRETSGQSGEKECCPSDGTVGELELSRLQPLDYGHPIDAPERRGSIFLGTGVRVGELQYISRTCQVASIRRSHVSEIKTAFEQIDGTGWPRPYAGVPRLLYVIRIEWGGDNASSI